MRRATCGPPPATGGHGKRSATADRVVLRAFRPCTLIWFDKGELGSYRSGDGEAEEDAEARRPDVPDAPSPHSLPLRDSMAPRGHRFASVGRDPEEPQRLSTVLAELSAGAVGELMGLLGFLS